MSAILIILIVLLVLVSGTAGFVAIRKSRGVPIEPASRPTSGGVGTLDREPSGTSATPSGGGSGTLEMPSPAELEAEELELLLEDTLLAGFDDEAGTALLEPPIAPIEPVEDVEPPTVEAPPRLRDRLSRARSAFSGYFSSIAGRSTIDVDTWDELEEALILADVGVGPTMELLELLRAKVRTEGIKDPNVLLEALKAELKNRIGGYDRSLRYVADAERTPVWLFVGVNGVGKTTTIGKVAARSIGDGRSVLLAAGDTFRAAAAEQLGMWAERSGADFVRGAEGGDPSSVIFDGIASAASKKIDLVLADTAGRLHTKTNLMEELAKVRRVADKEPGQVVEVLLVIDAITGQNGLTQARQFTEAADVTGVVLTKLDGSAKGGIVVAIQEDLGIPVKLVGLGESIGDLVAFDPDEFVEALFETL